MPPASTSLLFTWSFESVLLGLITLSVQSLAIEEWICMVQLSTACFTCLFHIISSAMNSDKHYEISIGYHCTITGMLVAIVYLAIWMPWVWPNGIRMTISVSYVVIVEFVSLAMVMSSTTSATPLFFDSVGHWVILCPLGLAMMWCGSRIFVPVVVGGATVVIFGLGCAPEGFFHFGVIGAAVALLVQGIVTKPGLNIVFPGTMLGISLICAFWPKPTTSTPVDYNPTAPPFTPTAPPYKPTDPPTAPPYTPTAPPYTPTAPPAPLVNTSSKLSRLFRLDNHVQNEMRIKIREKTF